MMLVWDMGLHFVVGMVSSIGMVCIVSSISMMLLFIDGGLLYIIKMNQNDSVKKKKSGTRISLLCN